MWISLSVSLSNPKTPATPPQGLTTLFEVLKIHSEIITTLSEAGITPSETLQPSEVHLHPPNPSRLCNCHTIWSSPTSLSPMTKWYHNTHYPRYNIGQGALFRMCAEDLWGCGSASDGVEHPLEGVGELQMWEPPTGTGRASEGVVSASDGVVRASEWVVTAWKWPIRDSENIVRTPKGFVRPE